MKNVLKKAVMMMLFVCMVLLLPQNAEAASKNLKQRGCKVDLKVGKKVSFKTNSIKFGKHTSYATLKTVKITDAKKDGYKQAKIVLTLDHNYTQKNMKALKDLDETNYKYEVVPDWAYRVVDYNTGDNLKVDNNKYDVTVKGLAYYSAKWAKLNTMMYYKIVVTITYPEDYKGVCFGYGEWSYLNQKIKKNPKWDSSKDTDGDLFICEEQVEEWEYGNVGTAEQIWPYKITKTTKYANKYIKADEKFREGKASFFKTGLYNYKYIRNNMHFVRIK